MPRVLITTVGTSLLTNQGWRHNSGSPLPDAADVQRQLGQTDPAKASAETNTLRALDPDNGDAIVLLHTDTPEGRFCSDQLCTFYRGGGKYRSVAQRQIDALGYDHVSSAQRGLRALVSIVIDEINKARNSHREPVLCATGGFKAEIAFLNLLGALLEVEVYYIHEQFREIVRLPRLPLAWNPASVLVNRSFFEWIDAEPRRTGEVENRLSAIPELRSLIEDSSDGHSYLNAAGNLLWQAAQAQTQDRPSVQWPSPDARPSGDKNGVSDIAHHRPAGWKQFVTRLCEIDCVTRVAYDDQARNGDRVKVLDAASGTLGVRFGTTEPALPLRVDTTARGKAQSELVAKYIRDHIVR